LQHFLQTVVCPCLGALEPWSTAGFAGSSGLRLGHLRGRQGGRMEVAQWGHGIAIGDFMRI
jgi:hypothetical protein